MHICYVIAYNSKDFHIHTLILSFNESNVFEAGAKKL